MEINDNTQKNKSIFDTYYEENINTDYIINTINNFDTFLADAKITDASWVGLYYNHFDKDLKSKKVLELGCGDCLNAGIMSALGAEVYANDISTVSARIATEINQKCALENPIHYIDGDFLELNLEENFFDIVIGKAFIHHLTAEQEILFTKKIVKVLKPDGLVRYFEPAINSKWLDTIRFMIPMKNPTRPSSLQKEKFKKWQEEDPHPHRDDSSKSYLNVGKQYFNKVEIICFGSIERYYRFLPVGNFSRAYRRFAFKAERFLPGFLRTTFSRSQLVIYQFPKK